MATREDIYAAIKNADAAGDSDSVQKLGAYLKTMDQPSPQASADAWAAKVRGDVVGDMSDFGKFVAGYGSAVPRLARGIGQRLGLVSQADVDEANRIDAPLLATKAGLAGNVGGNVAAALPTAAIPGAATIPVAAAIGGGLGAAQPTSTGETPQKNVAIGMAAGPLGVIAGKTIGAGYQGVKALLEPLFESGQQRIAGRVLQKFAENPSAIGQATAGPTATGAMPTLAEATGDRGLAQLQDALASSGNPQIANQLAGRATANNAARVNALQTLAGTDGARDAAVAARATTARQLYGDASATSPQLTAPQGKVLYDLSQAPAIQSAMKIAQANSANAGRPFDVASVDGLHSMKLALDGMMKDPQNAGQAAVLQGLKSAQQKLVGLIEDISPAYKTARTTYAQMSQPVNSFDVAAQVAKRGLSNGSDLTGSQTINRNALLGALKDEPALLRQATGRNVGNQLSDVMAPQDEAMLRQIAAEADRAGAVSTAGIGKGSPTAQRLATQNVLSQTFDSIGLPKGWADSTIAKTALKPLNVIYGGVAEPKIQQALAEAILDPAKAKIMIAAAAPAQRSALASFFQMSAAARSVPTTGQLISNRLSNRP